MHEWTVSTTGRNTSAGESTITTDCVNVQNFVAYNEFCIRACKDGPKAPALCEHIYDVLGCDWNMPGDYSSGSFDSCKGDSGEVRVAWSDRRDVSPLTP